MWAALDDRTVGSYESDIMDVIAERTEYMMVFAMHVICAQPQSIVGPTLPESL
jgi:hypothetical protein